MLYSPKDVINTFFFPIEDIIFCQDIIKLFVPQVSTVSIGMWLKEHIASTMVEMDHLELCMLVVNLTLRDPCMEIPNSRPPSQRWGMEPPQGARSKKARAGLGDK